MAPSYGLQALDGLTWLYADRMISSRFDCRSRNAPAWLLLQSFALICSLRHLDDYGIRCVLLWLNILTSIILLSRSSCWPHREGVRGEGGPWTGVLLSVFSFFSVFSCTLHAICVIFTYRMRVGTHLYRHLWHNWRSMQAYNGAVLIDLSRCKFEHTCFIQ